MIDLDAIEARLSAIGDVSWYVDAASGFIRDAVTEGTVADCYCDGFVNATFIAHAPEDVRALIDEVRRLRTRAFDLECTIANAKAALE